MIASSVVPSTSLDSVIEAVVFDLDGVLTDTASLHEAAWRRLFDELFARHPGAAPFTDADCRRCVDGGSRFDGLVAVLATCGIELPHGDPGDSSARDTVAGLARREDEYYLQLLHDRGPGAFASSVGFVRALRRHDIATAVVSSSRTRRCSRRRRGAWPFGRRAPPWSRTRPRESKPASAAASRWSSASTGAESPSC